MAAARLTQNDLNSIEELVIRVVDKAIDTKLPSIVDESIDTKIEPMVQRVVGDTIGGMFREFAQQASDQFEVFNEKIEQRFDEINIRFDRFEIKLDNNLAVTDRNSLEIRRLHHKTACYLACYWYKWYNYSQDV